MKFGRSLVDLAQELQRQQETKEDWVVPSSLMRMETSKAGVSTVVVKTPEADLRYGITDLARHQLADKLKIPYAYFERMSKEQPALLDQNVNTWLADSKDRRMVRALDGNVRAVLSDRYRRIDNFQIANFVLPVLNQAGAKPVSLQVTESRMYIKAVQPRFDFEVSRGDVVQIGVVITNSEVGHSRLLVQPLVYRLVCTNGLIMPDQGMQKNHLGRRAQGEDGIAHLFSDEALQVEDEALMLKIRDLTQACLAEGMLVSLGEKMRKTQQIDITGDPVECVERLSNRYAFNEDERSGVLRELIRGADLTGYGLLNAVTHHSHAIEDYDRATEFEVIGGRLLDLPPAEWKELAGAA